MGATSHQLGFCIKLEILDGLVVLDACLQFHHLVLKLNMAPIRGHRRRESAAPGAAPSQPFGAGGTLPREGPGPWMGAGSITLPSDKAEFRATLSRVTVDVPQHPGVHVRAPTGTLRGRGVQSQQQDAWFHEPYPHPPGGVLDLSLPGGGKSAWPLPPPSVPAQGTVASLPWISAILRPGLPSLSSCTEDSRAASSCLTASTASSLWAQRRGCWALRGPAGARRAGGGGGPGQGRGAQPCHPSGGPWGVPRR